MNKNPNFFNVYQSSIKNYTTELTLNLTTPLSPSEEFDIQTDGSLNDMRYSGYTIRFNIFRRLAVRIVSPYLGFRKKPPILRFLRF